MRDSIFKEVLRRPLGIAALSVLALLYLIAIFAPFLAPYRTSTQHLEKTYHPPTSLTWRDGGLHVRVYEAVDPAVYQKTGDTAPIQFFAQGYEYRLLGFIPWDRHLFTVEAPERIYLMGSDSTGRDVFSRLIYGSQVSLSIGLIGISITMTIGFTVGGLAGYFGGMVDSLAMRLVELLMAVPGLYLLLALRAAFADNFTSDQMFILIVIILAFIGWAGTARIIRGLSLSLRQRQFVLAAEVLGQSSFKILFRHILPNAFSYLVVAATLSIPAYILGEAALSFLGLGIQEPASSWGLMLSQAQDSKVFMMNLWWLLLPGAAIFITVIAYNVLGDVLRDIVDPKMKVQSR